MKIKLKRTFITGESGSFFLKSLLFLACFFLASTVSIYAQTKTITGVVTDAANEPLIGVSVRIQGTTTGSVTDLDGKYSVSANVGDVLDFTYVGMKPQSVKVDSQNTINIVLEDDATLLTETVVIGYGTARKRDLTGSIASVKASESADRPSSNPLASLQGRIAGVQVVNTGRAGQDPEIRVRGTNSINGYAPLYIVDGLFSDNINYLNPADIESMEILKDPSSLAIFGVRGANGVIIISTKRAKEGQTLVNINSSIGFKHISDRIKLTNASQFKELYNEQLVNQEADAPFDYTAWTGDTDWQDEIFQTGFITNNNVSITGSSEKNRFYLGLGYTSEEGSIKSEKFSKVTVNLSSDYNVTDFLRFGFQVNGSRMLPPDAKGVNGAMRAAPIAPIYGTYTDQETGKTETLFHTLPSFQNAQIANPLIDIATKGRHNDAKNHRIAGNIYGEADLLKNLTFKATFSYDYGINESRTYSPLIYVYNPDLNGKENTVDRETVTQLKTTNLVAQSDYILTYDNKFGKHGVTATAGITTNYREFSKLEAGRSQFRDDIYFSIPNDDRDKWWISSLDKTSMTNDGEQWRRFTMSYLLRGLYNYDNRYLLNASYRRDGSSVFRGVGNTWDNFYSVGAGWVISEEGFMADQNVIDYLKLKGSWGVLGSENTGAGYYPSYAYLTNSGSAVFGDEIITGYALKYLVQGLNWEKTHAWEIGFETNFLNQRLRFEPVYYSKLTKGIIVQLDGRNGYINSLENLGEVENKGFEISASWNDKIGSSDFRYSINGNLTTIKNKVKTLGLDDSDAKLDGVSRTATGFPIGYFYGYTVEGVYQNNEDIKQSPKNRLATVKPGDLKFKDIDGDGEITTADRGQIGNPTPDFTYGLNLNLSYKNFDLGIDMMGVYGNEIYRTWDASEFAQFNYLEGRMDRWHGEGTSNWEPILDPKRAINRMASNYFVEDGSFLRIRNIQLGYTFSPSLLNKINLKALRLYANVQNLKTWTKNTGYTPEIGGTALKSGIDDGTYPMPAIYTFGINLTF
ncbi:MAG: SusC/RagA family TonB-linked outer membrane protein [Dysgonomonas sp.]